MTNEYKTPPINEVVFGLRFEPFPAWRIPHVGRFWERVRENYPRAEHAAPLADVEVDEQSGLPPPRVWLVNEPEDQLIQIVPGRFLYNWRWRDDTQSYPRYAVLSEEAFRLFDLFSAFCEDAALGDVQSRTCELSYINHVRQPSGWKFPNDAGRVFPHVTDLLQSNLSPESIAYNTVFTIDDTNRLFTRLQSALLLTDNDPIFMFELTVRGLPQDESSVSLRNWFSMAHEWIVRKFDELTSSEAKKDLWQKL